MYKAWEKVSEKRSRLGLSDWVTVKAKDRRVIIEMDEEYMAEIAELDCCYVIKTDLPVEAADMDTVHGRYKDLALVERAFRNMKTGRRCGRSLFAML